MAETDRDLVRRQSALSHAEWVPHQEAAAQSSHHGHWMIRNGGTGKPLGTGPTREAAWVDAASRLRAADGG